MRNLLTELHETLARWSFQGYTDDRETPIADAYGRRILSMVDRLVLSMQQRARLDVLYEHGTGRTPAGRAALLGIRDVVQRCSSWPFSVMPDSDAVRLQLYHGYDVHVPIEPATLAQLVATIERELDDWALIVSDGIMEWRTCTTQGRAALTAAADDEAEDVADLVGKPPGAGLWVYSGRFGYRDDARTVSSGEGPYAMFPGNYRPATPEDLRLLGAVELWDWLDAFDDYDGEQCRLVVLAMHAPECPVYKEADAFATQPGVAAGEAEQRAREARLTGETCTCGQYAAHEPADITYAEPQSPEAIVNAAAVGLGLSAEQLATIGGPVSDAIDAPPARVVDTLYTDADAAEFRRDASDNT